MNQMYQPHQQQQHQKQMNMGVGQGIPKAQPLSQKDIYQQFYTNYKKSYDYQYYSKFDNNDASNSNQEENIQKLYDIWNEMHSEYQKTHPQIKNDEIISKNKPKQNDKNQKPQVKKQQPQQQQPQQLPNHNQQKKPLDQQAQQQIVKDKLEEIQKANPVGNNPGLYQQQQQQLLQQQQPQQQLQQQQHHVQVQQQQVEHDKIAQFQQYYQYQQIPPHQIMYGAPAVNPIPTISQPAYQQPPHYMPQQPIVYPQQQPYQAQYRQDIYPQNITAPSPHNPILMGNPPPMNYSSTGKLDISNYIASSLQK